MSTEQMVDYWRRSANETKTIAEESYANNHFDWAFFQWHLAIEKSLKGIIVKSGNVPPPIHDLAKLAEYAGVSISAQQRDHLDEITTYNIEARYDDYKRNFYKKVTKKEYYEHWQNICKEVFVWLSTMY